MTFSEYINYIINNPKDFDFYMVQIGTNVYYKIHYQDPITGFNYPIISFTIVEGELMETSTMLKIAKVEDVLLDKFKELSLK